MPALSRTPCACRPAAELTPEAVAAITEQVRVRVLRSCARRPFAFERLELLDAARVLYRLPKPPRDGTTALTLTPLEPIDHFAALIPPPRRLGGHPRSVGRFARSQAPAAARRVTVERPQRSEDERP